MFVVALHGFLGQGRDWNLVRESLGAEAGEFVAPDLFRSGDVFDSSAREDFWNFARLFNDHLRARLHAAAGPRILLGYSLGGRLAFHCGFAEPSLWDHIVVLSAHPGLMEMKPREARMVSDREWARRFRKEPWDTLMTDWNNQEVFEGTQKEIRPESEFDRELLAQALENWSLSRQELPWAAGERPTLSCLVGDRDAKFMKVYEEVGSPFGLCPLVVKGAGHRIHIDSPESVAAAIRAVL